jgi:small subunit ribosomal protein S16
MAVKLRLKRMGAKKKPVYRIVVMESSKPRDGRSIEVIGQYEPRQEPVVFNIKEERVKYWLSVGAQPTEPVTRLLGNAGIIEKVARTCGEPGVSRKEKKAREEA